MSKRYGQANNEMRIPIGIFIVSVGFIIIIAVLAILLLAPRATASSTQPNIHLAQLPTIAPTAFVKTYVHRPTPNPNVIRVTAPVLLPEYSGGNRQGPSVSTADDAQSVTESAHSSQPRRLTIPTLGIDAPISRVQLDRHEENGQIYYQWQVPSRYEIGWHETSALLGSPGNTVLNGHNNIYGEIFRDLIELEIGEEIIVYDESRPYIYQVTQKELMEENDQPLEVRLENARWIRPTADERLTLVTCWPFATNSHRLVVIAKPVDRT